MRCPHCSARSTRVVDSRSTDQGQAVRRRRNCDRCGRRFTTYERIEEVVPVALQRSRGSAAPRVAAVGGPGGRRRRRDGGVLWIAEPDVAFSASTDDEIAGAGAHKPGTAQPLT